MQEKRFLGLGDLLGLVGNTCRKRGRRGSQHIERRKTNEKKKEERKKRINLNRTLTLNESVLEPPGKVLHVPHAASAGGPPADGLATPAISPLSGVRVTAGSAQLVLNVVRTLVAAAADGVGLGQMLSLAGSSIGLIHTKEEKKERKIKYSNFNNEWWSSSPEKIACEPFGERESIGRAVQREHRTILQYP